jgi:hypothetical protein
LQLLQAREYIFKTLSTRLTMDQQPARPPPPNGITAFLDTLREVECSICEESFSNTHAPVITTCNQVFGMHCL